MASAFLVLILHVLLGASAIPSGGGAHHNSTNGGIFSVHQYSTNGGVF
ncbi:MAG: hypothetical protein M3R53_09875 [Candidatus Eremiobacteraeota bacterium]|nr:hypothetical protein [Candidatus Eremiobacteraeota bacterium]